ncbi:RNA-directed RNA polymerase L [Frankliniella fusca]|uniref:RNA-directed RNA polymerase L n=1 Tax=Frankliniella fusca TaxID=407009 RepID=A0AAE1H1N0_9NEOP|nr:RNA-directed RNA polymerase L [Frankliniella fusca]
MQEISSKDPTGVSLRRSIWQNTSKKRLTSQDVNTNIWFIYEDIR